MLVEQVIYRNEQEVEVNVTLQEIYQRTDYLEVKENLYCATNGCECKMIYVPRGIKSAYFRKAGKNHNHSLDCDFYKSTDDNGRPRRIVGTENTALSTARKQDILKGIYKTYTETDEERQNRLERDRLRRLNRRANRRVDSANDELEVRVNNPSTSNTDPVETRENRSRPVRRRHSVPDILNSDIGERIAVVGEIVSLTNDENFSLITITDSYSGQTFNLYLEEVFYENSPLDISTRLNTIREIINTTEGSILSGLGQIVERNDSKGLLVLAEEDIRIDALRLAVYVSQNL
ncbi:hypothetical protein KV679_00575 [Bacillus sp. JRC01]|nr:hypothetical protein [Bacillus sp. JRC01]